jgi:hypothetical protein
MPNTPTHVYYYCYYSFFLAKSSAILPTTFSLPSPATLFSALSPINLYSNSKLFLNYYYITSISIRRLDCLNPSIVITKEEKALATNPVIARRNPVSRISISNSAKLSREGSLKENKEKKEDIAAA